MNKPLITNKQRAKIHALISEFADQYGEKNIEDMKQSLKNWFERGNFSLSNCSKELAREFTKFILYQAYIAGYDFGELEEENTSYNMAYMSVDNKSCIVCNSQGEVLRNRQGKRLCVCKVHKEELRANPEEFKRKYYVTLV